MRHNLAQHSITMTTDSDLGELEYTAYYNVTYEDNSINTPVGTYERIDLIVELVGVVMFGKLINYSRITKQILEDIIAEEHTDE